MMSSKLPGYHVKDIRLLKCYKNNSRKHSKNQIKRIENSIKEFGFTNPVIVNENTIVAGHARVEAAKNLDIKEIPTVDVSYLSEKQVKAYVIADNRLAELSEWDHEVLKDELFSLKEVDFDLNLIGYEDFNFENSDDEATVSSDNLIVEKFEIVVECQDEVDQEKIYNLMKSKGYKCRILNI